MSKIEIGTIVKTSYGTGPYVVTGIYHEPYCISLTCRGGFSLNHYDPDTLKNIYNNDYLIITGHAGGQGELF